MKTQEQTFLSVQEVRPLVGNPSVSTIYRWMDLKIFPKPVKLGPNKVGWRTNTVLDWAQDPEAWRDQHVA